MEFTWAEEGNLKFLIPVTDPRHSFPPASAPVFYNPRMEFSRDATVLLCKVLPVTRYLDLMGATGIRGLRVARECGVPVTINDRDPEAVSLIRMNRDLLGIPAEVTLSDAHALLASRTFETVDLDPFGSPAPFIDSAVRGCGRFLFVTATDTAPLCGAHRNAGIRRYFAMGRNTEYHAEAGLRILVGFIAREAARYDRGIHPLFCYSREHHFRVHVRLLRGTKRADRSCGMMGYVMQCPRCVFRTHESGVLPPPGECPSCRVPLVPVGPLWTGSLHDRDVLDSFRAAIAGSGYRLARELQTLTATCAGEIDIPFHYEYHHLARHFRVSPPPIGEVMDYLRKRGYSASRAHFSGTALKTDAPLPVIREAIAGQHRG